MNASDQPLDAYQLIASMTDHQVEFVVIGGVAEQAHGHVPTTVELEVDIGSRAAGQLPLPDRYAPCR